MNKKKFYSHNDDPCDSGYERDVVNSCIARKLSYEYHPGPFAYSTPIVGGFCASCDGNSVRQSRLYTPDLRLLPSGRLIEIKGYFPAPKRNLMNHFLKTKATQSELRFIFQADRKTAKAGRTRYLDWARKNHVVAVAGTVDIPEEWCYE